MAKEQKIRGSKVTKSPYSLLRRPIITEKAATQGSVNNCFVFDVHPKATKTEIRDAVEKIFEVNVVGVRTCRAMGKLKRIGVHIGREAGTKKAFVTLKQGDSIPVIEGL